MAPLTNKTLRTAPLAALALALVAAQAGAQTMVRLQEAGFKLKKRSLWKNAAYYGHDVLYGFDWNKSGSFGGIGKLDIPPVDFGALGTSPGTSLGETGVVFDYAVSGTLGLNCYAGAFGGEVDADYSANLTYSYPLLVEAGNPITVRVTYRTNPNAHFDSSTPQYRAGVDLVAQLDASLAGRGRFLDANVFDEPNIIARRRGRAQDPHRPLGSHPEQSARPVGPVHPAGDATLPTRDRHPRGVQERRPHPPGFRV